MSESVVAYEAGYRVQPVSILSLDLAAYHNDYDRLRSQEPGPPNVLANGLRGQTSGLETQVTVRPTGWMRWEGSWTLFDKQLELRPGSADITRGADEGNDPQHQLGLRSSINLPHRTELEGFLRHVGALPAPAVPAYTELDLRAGWSVTDDVELALVGRNLLHASHPEFGPPDPAARRDRAESVRAAARELLMRRRRHRARRRVACWPLLQPAAAADSSGEYDVKAAYLYNFAKFVAWPPQSFASPRCPVRDLHPRAGPVRARRSMPSCTVNGSRGGRSWCGG